MRGQRELIEQANRGNFSQNAEFSNRKGRPESGSPVVSPIFAGNNDPGYCRKRPKRSAGTGDCACALSYRHRPTHSRMAKRAAFVKEAFSVSRENLGMRPMPVSGMFPIASSSFFEHRFLGQPKRRPVRNRAQSGRPSLLDLPGRPLRRALEFPDLKPPTERRFSSRVSLVCRRRMGKLSSEIEKNAC